MGINTSSFDASALPRAAVWFSSRSAEGDVRSVVGCVQEAFLSRQRRVSPSKTTWQGVTDPPSPVCVSKHPTMNVCSRRRVVASNIFILATLFVQLSSAIVFESFSGVRPALRRVVS